MDGLTIVQFSEGINSELINENITEFTNNINL